MDISSFRTLLTKAGVWTSKLGSFVLAAAFVALWIITSPGDIGWHEIATIATLFMTLLIQRVEHRDTQAVHAKLDELLKSDARARTELAAIDKRDPEEIELHLAGGQESPQLTVLAKVAEVHSLLSSDGRGIEVAANGL